MKEFFNIKINKTPYKVEQSALTGRELLSLAGLSANEYTLFLVHGNDQTEISADETVEMKNGLHFQAIINEIKFG